jgi:hypothetical protein
MSEAAVKYNLKPTQDGLANIITHCSPALQRRARGWAKQMQTEVEDLVQSYTYHVIEKFQRTSKPEKISPTAPCVYLIEGIGLFLNNRWVRFKGTPDITLIDEEHELGKIERRTKAPFEFMIDLEQTLPTLIGRTFLTANGQRTITARHIRRWRMHRLDELSHRQIIDSEVSAGHRAITEQGMSRSVKLVDSIVKEILVGRR